MAVYIKKTNPFVEASINKYIAKVGFSLRGEEVIEYDELKEILPLNEDDIVVDYIGGMYELLDCMNIEYHEYDYPKALEKFYNRKIKPGILADIFNKDGTIQKSFIKPRFETKVFTGKVIEKYSDLVGLNVDMNYPVWISEPINIIAEWRTFIVNQEIIAIQKYRGEYGVVYDFDVVKQAVLAWKESPSSYVLDIGLTDKGETVVVEVNDGFSVGFYGIAPHKAAIFLEHRWREMTKKYFDSRKEKGK